MRSVAFGLRPLSSSRDDRWLQSWQPALVWLASCNSLHTRRAYTTALRALMHDTRAELAGVQSIHVAQFKMAMVSRRLAPRTVRQRLAIVGAFFAWAIAQGYHPGPNPASSIPLPRAGRDPAGVALTGDQVEQLLAAAGNVRDRAILALLADGGLRAGELAALQQRDLLLERTPENGVASATLTIRHGKGGYPRTVALSSAAAAALVQYLAIVARRPGAVKPLFQHLDGDGLAISYHVVYRAVRKAAVAAGLGGLAPHDLRRTYATRALDLGEPAPEVQRQMGHRTMEQTVRYYRGGR